MEQLVFVIVSLIASTVGAICGIGGGVVIKPTLDLTHLASVSTISFLSGCTVLSMSLYSVGKGIISRDSQVEMKTATPLGIGAAVGGVLGQYLFTCVRQLFSQQNTVGAVQAACLFFVTLATLVYTVNKEKVRTLRIENAALCALIGLALGVVSSFLGIGGGPINLMVLGFFFSMKTKTAAQNSIYIILMSQAANLLTTFAKRNVPEFEWLTLILMILGGIGGGILGRMLNKKLNHRQVDKLFVILMIVIMCICVFNTYRYGWASA